MHHTIPRPTAARDIATWAERNIGELALLTSRSMARATSDAEREELACVGIALARARQHLLPLVRREEV